MGDRWGDEGPPDEAYSRVTDAQRFAPLLAVADELVADLRSRYDVVVNEEPGGERGVLSALRLHPVTGQGADLVVVRTDFPGVHLRAGRWTQEAFPHCGCDACDEQVEDLVEELGDVVADVVAGRFGEELTAGAVLRTWRLGSSSSAFLDPAGARAAGHPGRYDWGAWPERAGPAGR